MNMVCWGTQRLISDYLLYTVCKMVYFFNVYIYMILERFRVAYMVSLKKYTLSLFTYNCSVLILFLV